MSLVEFITTHGANVDSNLEELWRRIVFNIAVSNCDDHLRNHGFILTDKGWILSPAYDINPDEYGTIHLSAFKCIHNANDTLFTTFRGRE